MDTVHGERGSAGPAARERLDSTGYADGGRLLGDVLALLIAPLVMVAVFMLPEAVKRSYAFSYTEPTAMTAFTAHYVHLTPGHLVGNVVGFLLLASVGYGLSVIAGRRRLFFASLATFLVTFPFVLSGLNLAFPRNAIGFGFSGINMALFGYVAVVLVIAVGDEFGTDPCRYLPALFIGFAGYIGVIALPPSAVSIGLASVAAVLAVSYGRSVGDQPLRSLPETIGRVSETPVYAPLTAVGVVVLLGYPFVGFPGGIQAEPRINVYIHFLGYALAYLVVYVSLLVDRSGRLWRPTRDARGV